MSNTTSINSELIATLIGQAQFAAYEQSIARQLVSVFDLPAGAGKSVQVPVWSAVSASLITDESAASAADTNTTSASITLAEHVVYHRITNMLRDSASADVFAQLGDQSGRAIAESLDGQVFTLFDNLSGNTAILTQSVGSAGSDNTPQDIMKAAAILRANKLTGPFYAVLHPKQAYGIKANLTATTSYTNSTALGSEVLSMGYIGELAGVRIFESALVPVDGSDDATGCVFAPSAFGHAMRGTIDVAQQYMAAERATDLVLTGVAGAQILQATHAVRVVGDATV
jgi:N4-gp56 family major capsid protein